MPNQITAWKAQRLDGAAGVFDADANAEPASQPLDVTTLYAKIGELTLTNDFLSVALTRAGPLGAER